MTASLRQIETVIEIQRRYLTFLICVSIASSPHICSLILNEHISLKVSTLKLQLTFCETIFIAILYIHMLYIFYMLRNLKLYNINGYFLFF